MNYKKMFLLSLFTFGQLQASFFTDVIQSFKDNKVTTFLTCSTVFFGFIAFTLWQKNNNLSQEKSILFKRNNALKRKKSKNIKKIEEANILLQEANSLINEVITGENQRKEIFKDIRVTQRNVNMQAPQEVNNNEAEVQTSHDNPFEIIQTKKGRTSLFNILPLFNQQHS